MGIKFNCPSCGESLNIKAKLAGMRGICPKCKAKIQIPSMPVPEVIENVQVEEEPVFQPSTASMSNPVGNAQAQPASEPAVAIPVASEIPPVPTAASTPDPFADAPNAVWYMRPPGGGQYGPASTELMKQWYAEGRIGANSLVWRDGWADWLLAGQVFNNSGGAQDSQISASQSGIGIATQPQPTGGADQRKISYYRNRKRKATMAITIITIGVVIILGLIVLLLIILSQQ